MQSNSTNGAHERAAAYARSSDDKQEASCGQQLAWARQKAEVCGLELAVIRFDDGVPGDVIDRPGLEALFADLARHQKAGQPVTKLLLFDEDRLSRATSWATGPIIDRLMGHGVEWFVLPGRELDLWDDMTRTMYGVQQDLGRRAYVKGMSRNISRALGNLGAAGKWCGGSPPYAYRVSGEKYNYHLVPGPAGEVEAVRWLFAEAARGVLSARKLAELAEGCGWPAPVASTRRRKTPGWTGRCVLRILRSRVYLGVIRYGKRRTGKYYHAVPGEPHEKRGRTKVPLPVTEKAGCHEPLIDAATFEAAQAALDSRRFEQRAGHPRPGGYAFSGKLVCAACGGVMHGSKGGYICSTWKVTGECARNGIAEDMLTVRVATLLARELDSPATLARMRGRLEARRTACGAVQREALEKGRKQVAELEAQIVRGNRRLLSVDDDLLPGAQAELRRLKAELATAQGDLGTLERTAAAAVAEQQDVETVLARLSELPAILRTADAQQRARVVRAAVENIVMRFTAKRSPRGYQMTRWLGGTVTLRGGGAPCELPAESPPPGPSVHGTSGCLRCRCVELPFWGA
jgi:DNA invertase Pin-like site-specific DNA recombinase